MGVGGQHHAPAALPRERDLVPIVQAAGRESGAVWTGRENPGLNLGPSNP